MKTIGVFAGSFNPWHEGHQDVLDQASKIFNKVVVVQGFNPDKEEPKFNGIPADIDFHTYTGLLTDELVRLEADYKNVTLIRGLRGIKDLEYEEEQLYWLRELKPDLKHVFIMCKLENKFISSSALRTLKKYKK